MKYKLIVTIVEVTEDDYHSPLESYSCYIMFTKSLSRVLSVYNKILKMPTR